MSTDNVSAAGPEQERPLKPLVSLSQAFIHVAVALMLFAAAVLLASCGLEESPSWSDSLQAVDEALARGDDASALRARHDAYRAALASHRWEALLAVGNASLRLRVLPGAAENMTAEARRLCLLALFRARQQGSLEGVLTVTEDFAAMGDRDVARQAYLMASAMAAERREPEATARVVALAQRLGQRPPAWRRGGASAPLGPGAGAVSTQ